MGLGPDATAETLATFVERLVPKSLPADVRSEVFQQLTVAILARKIKVVEAERFIPRLVSQAFRECRGEYKTISIDAPLGENGITLAEMLEG